jgi:hypothetical protein
MKKLIVALICLLPAKAVLAQKDLLSFDERNKYIYYQVVEQPGLVTDTLHARALYFLKTAYPDAKIKQAAASGNFTGSSKFLVFSGNGMLKHEDGEIAFNYYIDCKDQKYRYWLTDFVFTPHKIDRYGTSVAEAGIDIPLETGLSNLTKKDIDSYLSQTGTYSKQFGDELRRYMNKISALPVETKKKVISTKDW